MNVASIVRGAKFAATIVGGARDRGLRQAAGRSEAMAGAAAPGSQQDFVVNVGDRVFFDTNSSELSAQARATLDKQAQWLGNYNRYAFTIEGHADERGTREYNIALGARRAETVREYLTSRGVSAAAHAHDLLRQGTAGRGVQRHFLLVAESPRRDRAQSELVSRTSGGRSRNRHHRASSRGRAWLQYLPCVRWLADYRLDWLRGDAIAGLTLAAYAIPVSLAYAALAGVPPQVGIYGYLLGGIGYALLGSSRHLAIGPTSAISLMIAGTVGTMADGDVQRYAQIASLTGFTVAALCIIAWLLRLSVLVKLISDSILVGFKAGAGLTIAMTSAS